MHEPGWQNTTGGYVYAPTWPQHGLVEIYDGVYGTLSSGRQAKWWETVKYALQQWSACGLNFRFSAFDDDPIRMSPDTDQDFISATVHPYATFARMTHKYGGVILGAGGWWPAPNGTEQGSIAAFYIGATFWALGRWNQRFIVTHEIGHALGLKHNTSQYSVMYGKGWVRNEPDQHDIDALRWYYQT